MFVQKMLCAIVMLHSVQLLIIPMFSDGDIAGFDLLVGRIKMSEDESVQF